jgi:hypothetical protein
MNFARTAGWFALSAQDVCKEPGGLPLSRLCSYECSLVGMPKAELGPMRGRDRSVDQAVMNRASAPLWRGHTGRRMEQRNGDRSLMVAWNRSAVVTPKGAWSGSRRRGPTQLDATPSATQLNSHEEASASLSSVRGGRGEGRDVVSLVALPLSGLSQALRRVDLRSPADRRSRASAGGRPAGGPADCFSAGWMIIPKLPSGLPGFLSHGASCEPLRRFACRRRIFSKAGG